MSYGCWQHGWMLYFKSKIKRKRSPPLRRCRKAWVTHWLDEINIMCPHLKYEVVDNNWREYDWKFLEENVWRKKGRDCGMSNYEGNQHPRNEIFDYDISRKDMKTLMEVWKRRRPFTKDIFWICVNMYTGCWCKLEDVLMKDHHKCNFEFNNHFLF